jgi:peptidoglycan hydrolase CwlO-like protein
MGVATSSKVIGIRMPLEEYLEFVREASSNNMTNSDYGLQILLFERKKYKEEIMAKGGLIIKITEEFEKLKKENDELRSDNVFLTKQVEELQTRIKGYQVMIKHKDDPKK